MRSFATSAASPRPAPATRAAARRQARRDQGLPRRIAPVRGGRASRRSPTSPSLLDALARPDRDLVALASTPARRSSGTRCSSSMASNYVRLRLPAAVPGPAGGVAAIEDATSTYGPGQQQPGPRRRLAEALLGFLWQPGKSLEQLDPGPRRRPELRRRRRSTSSCGRPRSSSGRSTCDDDIKVVKRRRSPAGTRPGLDLDSPDAAATVRRHLRPDDARSRSVATASAPPTSPQRSGRLHRHDRDGPRRRGRHGAVPRPRRQRANRASRSARRGRSRVKSELDAGSHRRSRSTASTSWAGRPAASSSASGTPPTRASRRRRTRAAPVAFSFPSSTGHPARYRHLAFTLSLSVRRRRRCSRR